MRRIPRCGDDDVDPLVGERPFEERLLPSLDPERPQRLELAGGRRGNQGALAAEWPHHDHGDAELGGKRKHLALSLPLARIERHLDGLEPPRLERLGQLAQGRRAEVSDAEEVDPAGRAFRLQPGEMLAPEHEVVDLFDLDTVEPSPLALVLGWSLAKRTRPDLGGGGSLEAPFANDAAQRPFGAAVHRRRVDDAAVRVQGSLDDLPSQRRVIVERLPGSESDDRAKPPLLHQPMSVRASLPAAKAEAKNHGSSSGPRPMWSSGRPSQAARHSLTSSSRPQSSQSGASRPTGQATETSPRQSSKTARVWCETPRWRARSSPLEARTANTGEPPSAVAVFAASAAASPPWPSREEVPTIPGPIEHTTASSSSPAAQARAEATVTHSRSPPKQEPAVKVAPTSSRA